MAKTNRIFKLKVKVKDGSEKPFYLIMGDNYKRFEDHFVDITSHYTDKWHYDDTPEGKGKCLGRTLKVEFIELLEAKERFVGFGGLKCCSEESYNSHVEEHNKNGTAYKPCKRIEEINFKPNLALLKELIASHRIIKLNDGNDGIPPKPKDLGILPTII